MVPIKDRMTEAINQNVTKISKFYDWRKPSWKCPLSETIRTKITKNINYGNNIWKPVIQNISKNTKKNLEMVFGKSQ